MKTGAQGEKLILYLKSAPKDASDSETQNQSKNPIQQKVKIILFPSVHHRSLMTLL